MADDSPEDTFEDAVEMQAPESNMDMSTAIAETQAALNLFLNNRFELAREKMEPRSHESMYHSLGHATIVFIKALMTCDHHDVEHAVTVAKQASALCDQHRRVSHHQSSLTRLVKTFDKAGYTEEQMHAELCYAETLLLRALLTFLQDENLVSFVRGALRIRSCYQSYRECQRIYDTTIATASSQNGPSRNLAHYESGVRMGVGAFNLMISTLPSRVLRLLEFVGFTGDKDHGLQQLTMAASSAELTLRGPLCSLSLLSWNLVFMFVMSTGEGDIEACRELLEPLRKNYPKGALILYFAGRLAEVQAQLTEAIALFHESTESQNEWTQFHHICYWDLSFCYAFDRQWMKAAEYASKMYTENRWSKATYAYITAIFLMADENSSSDEGQKERIKKLLEEVPGLKVRIAGKSIPMEKFCIMKANRFKRKDEQLVLAHYELLYLWNGFCILGKDAALIKPILQSVELVLSRFGCLAESDIDDYCLCLLLKGMCLKHLQSPFQAEQCLLEITTFEKQIQDNYYLIPYALYELSLLKMENDTIPEAKHYLMKAREHKGYSMESRLHFRMHAINERLSLKTP